MGEEALSMGNPQFFRPTMTHLGLDFRLGTASPHVKGGLSEISMKPKFLLHYSMNLTQTPQAHTHTQ